MLSALFAISTQLKHTPGSVSWYVGPLSFSLFSFVLNLVSLVEYSWNYSYSFHFISLLCHVFCWPAFWIWNAALWSLFLFRQQLPRGAWHFWFCIPFALSSMWCFLCMPWELQGDCNVFACCLLLPSTPVVFDFVKNEFELRP